MFTREMNFQKHIPALKEAGFLPEKYEVVHNQDFVILEIMDQSIYIKKCHADYVLKRYKVLQKAPFRGYINYFKSMNSSFHDRGWINCEDKLFMLDAYLLKHKKFKSKTRMQK